MKEKETITKAGMLDALRDAEAKLDAVAMLLASKDCDILTAADGLVLILRSVFRDLANVHEGLEGDAETEREE